MRAGTVVAAVLVLAAAGCSGMGKKLGFTDESDKNWSEYNTQPGVLDPAAPESMRVRVQKFEPSLKGPTPRVKVALKNEGEFQDFFSVEVEFGYPAEAGSFAEYTPEFTSIDQPEFKKNDVVEREVTPPQGKKEEPLFARLVVLKPEDGVRMTTGREITASGQRHGSTLLAGRVEVVAVDGDLSATPPRLSFTLENVDPSGKAIGELRYAVQYHKEGKFLELGSRLSGARDVGEPLGEKGKRVTFQVANLERVVEELAKKGQSLAGAKPVLRLVQK